MTSLKLDLGERGYEITVGRGLLSSISEYMNLDRKVFIVTDSGVPTRYAEAVKASCREAMIYTVGEGEGSKSIEVYAKLLEAMLDFGMTRSDCAVAVGGGVVGDLTGFLSASYMRGIDFYNVPTTLLSQVDSSIGGKTAVNLAGVKNIVGAFYQPRAVVIDTDVLKTLPERHIAAGLAEALKMSMTSDRELFSLFESSEIGEENIEEVIVRSLIIKRDVVEKDEKEAGLRKILNFGHTFGHGIESEAEMRGLYHGECVALGMIPMCSDEVRARLIPILKKLGLPTEYDYDTEAALAFVTHDKKCSGDSIEAIFVDEIGSFRIEKMAVSEFCDTVKRRLSKQC